LSRWSVEGCANCQTHLETKAFFSLQGLRAEAAPSAGFEVEIRTRDGVLERPRAMAAAAPAAKLFRLEVH
jgi:tyrosinase